MRPDFLSFCQKNVVLVDGGVGTELYAKGYFINTCYDELNLTRPEIVQDVHRGYIDAGADVIETNTFGANRMKLQKYGLEDKLAEINRRGAELAREAAGNDIYVAGSIGPVEDRMEPWGSLTEQKARDIFCEQASALIAGGVDLICLETFLDLHLIQQAIKGIRAEHSIPILAQMTIDDDGKSLFGTPPEILAVKMKEAGADAVGLNCRVGPKVMLDAAARMISAVDIPVSVMPNAGSPQNVEGRNIYLASAEYFADYAKRFVQIGVRIIGSCCGTNAEFTRAMHQSIRSVQPRTRITRIAPVESQPASKEIVATPDRSRLARKITAKSFVTTVEIVPPRGADVSTAVHQAQKMTAAGIDAVNIPDGPRALSRMSAGHLAFILQQETGAEVIQHYACRDRNLLGMVGDLLGAYAAGIRNLLIVTGDPPKMGTYPGATAVFDVDSVGLTHVISSMNLGFDLGGNPLPKPTGFYIGVGVNPGAVDLEYEIRRFEAKISAGAQFAITQPVFDVSIFFEFLKRTKPNKIPLIAGIWPLISVRNAEFMNNEVPGAHVPIEIMNRLKTAGGKEAVRKEGLKIARETLARLRPHIAGAQVSMPFGKLEYPLEVLKDVL